MATATSIATLANVLKEELSFVRAESEPEVDGIFSKFENSSAGVERGVGRTWQVLHTFSTGLAGGFKNVLASGPSTADTTATGQSLAWGSSPRTFPALTEVTAPNYFQRTLTLVQGMGNLALPFQYSQADRLDASIMSAVSLIMKGTGKKVTQSDAIMLYQNDRGGAGTIADRAIIALVTAGDGAGNTDVVDGPQTGVSLTITFDGTNVLGRVGRLMPGMLVDLYTDADVKQNSAAGSLGAAVDLIVQSVDYVSKSFVLATVDASTGLAPADVDANDYIVLKDSVGVGPSGFEDWMVNSGTAFGVALASQPQLKSLIAAVGGVLDETTKNKFVGGFFDAYGSMYSVDTMITTTGVLNAHLESLDGLGRYDRQNQAMKPREGWVSIDYTWGGRGMQILLSRYMKSGQALFMKSLDGNLKRYIPPPVKSTRKGVPDFPQDIQFIAPWLGSSSIFMPATSSDGVTEFAQAPFTYFREFAPVQMPGIKLTGLTELNP